MENRSNVVPMTDKDKFVGGYTVMKHQLANVIFDLFGGWEAFKLNAPKADDYSIIENRAFTDVEYAVSVYQAHQKLFMEWLIDEAISLEYDDVIELVNGDRDIELDIIDKRKHTDAEVALALFCYNVEAHNHTARQVVCLAMQLLCHDYGSFIRYP